MATGTLLDHSYTMAPEVTYNTPVTVTRSFEALVDSSHDWDPKVLQGQGLRVGSRFLRSGRRISAIGQGKLTVHVEAVSKGLGLFLEQLIGTATSTLVSAATYQENFTPVPISGSYDKSCTWQVGVVEAAGVIDTYTYAGCTGNTLEIDQPQAGICTIKGEFDARSIATATSYVTPVYAAAPANLLNFVSGSVAINSTFTAPTTIALASLSAGVTINVRAFNFKVDNGLDDQRWIIGGRNQPTTGLRKGTVTLDVEYDAMSGTILRDAQINQTAFPVILTLTGATLGVGSETLQIALPSVMIDSGAIPDPKDDKVVVTQIQCAILDPLTGSQPYYLSMRTADIAL